MPGSRGGAVVRALASHQCGPVSIPGVDAISGLRSVVGSRPCSDGLNSPDTPVFLPPQKPAFPNSNSSWKQWTNSHSVDVPLKFPFILFIYIPKFSC